MKSNFNYKGPFILDLFKNDFYSVTYFFRTNYKENFLEILE